MKKFRFPLETLLKLRIREEEQSQLKLAEAIRRCEDINRGIDAAQAKYDQSLIEQSLVLQQNTTVDSLMNYVYYRETLLIELSQLREQLLQAKLAEEEQRVNYLQARKQRKVVEKLKARKLQQHWQGLLKEEQVFMDELATTAYLKDRPNPSE